MSGLCDSLAWREHCPRTRSRLNSSASMVGQHTPAPDDTRSSGWTQSSHPLALRSERVRPPGSSAVAVERCNDQDIRPETGPTWRRWVRQPTKPRRFQARSDGSAPLLLPMSRTQGGSDRACRARRDGRTAAASLPGTRTATEAQWSCTRGSPTISVARTLNERRDPNSGKPSIAISAIRPPTPPPAVSLATIPERGTPRDRRIRARRRARALRRHDCDRTRQPGSSGRRTQLAARRTVGLSPLDSFR